MTSYSVIGPDGRAYGPADEVVLAQWAREGRVVPQTVLRCEQTGVQRPAQSIPSLVPVLGLPPQVVNALMHTPPAPLPYAQPLAYTGAYAPAPHTLDAFSTPVAVLLHFVTFGIFSWIHFGLMHDRLPVARQDDPPAVKAICFYLIPFFNIYWMFFEKIRLCDRINEQRRLVGLPETAPRGLAIAYSIMAFIPYINILIGFPIIGAIYYGTLRASVNELVYATRGTTV